MAAADAAAVVVSDAKLAAVQDGKTKTGGGGGGGHGHGGYKGQMLDQDRDGRLYWLWLLFCFCGIMCAFIAYGIAMEYATSGGRKLHEFSLIFVTSSLYSLTAYIGKHARGEEETTVATWKLLGVAVLSMGSTFTSVRSLRYVIFPVQVLAKSCKPIPVMLMGALLGKKYPLRKYINVSVITLGVALFMGCGDKEHDDSGKGGAMMLVGVALLFVSLSFDGATGAYEDKIMSTAHVGPFELMYNIQLGKCILAALCLIFLNEVNYFFQMCIETGPVLVILGFTGAIGQVFIFVTISKFGALTCSIIGLARKITTLVASILIYGHSLNMLQFTGLCLAVGAMIYNFLDKSGKKKGGKGGAGGKAGAGPAAVDEKRAATEEVDSLLKDGEANEGEPEGDEEAGGADASATTAAADDKVDDDDEMPAPMRGADQEANVKHAFKAKRGKAARLDRKMSKASVLALSDQSLS